MVFPAQAATEILLSPLRFHTASNQTGNSVSVLKGDGAGGFTASTPVPGFNAPRPIAMADLDALVSSSGTNNVRILTNSGTGAFTRHPFIGLPSRDPVPRAERASLTRCRPRNGSGRDIGRG